jgi:pimeloyl-ACP methyl ester carboxylesterase/DNA-binding CsgD family transcriptional regulator
VDLARSGSTVTSSHRPPAHTIGFGRSADGVRVAYAVAGEGPPLLMDTCWVSQLEYDWQSPVWRHFLAGLTAMGTVVRYDERGFGLSDWDVPDFSFEARLGDLEAVVAASALQRFALLGMAQGGPVAIAYAHAHPERVSRLILLGTYASLEGDPDEMALDDALTRLIEVGWGRPEGRFRRVFTDMFMPGASDEQMCWMDELMRRTTSPANAAAYRRARSGIDVRALLPELRVPTLVLHARGDQVNPFAEGRRIAAAVPGARLVTLETDNHVLLESDPASAVFFAEVARFLADDADVHADVAAQRSPASVQREALLSCLTLRERDVLALVAVGRDNAVVAQQLSLSVRTVERHLQTVYRKLGLTGSAQRTAAAALVLGGDSYASTATAAR